jgi:flagellar motor switch protein FliG
VALNGYEKAAVFLRTIGEERAAEILKSLDVDDISKISSCMTKLKTVSKEDVEEVFREAADKISSGEVYARSDQYLKRVLSKVLGEERANMILDMIAHRGPIESIKDIDSKTLTNFLVTEHPQTIALALCLIEPTQAAEVLASLPEQLKADVAARIASTERIPSNAIEELESALKGLDINKGKGTRLGGVKTIAEILNRADRTTEQMILEKIEEEDSTLAESIRQLMFVFDDIVHIDDKGVQLILREVSTDELSVALKTASDELKEKIFKNMSQRAAQILKEEMEVRGPVRVSEVEKAQQNIVKVVRRLEEEGKIVLPGKGGEEIVV